MKYFLDQLNDVIAPATRAWKEMEIVTVTIQREGFGADSDDELIVDVRLLLKKKENS